MPGSRSALASSPFLSMLVAHGLPETAATLFDDLASLDDVMFEDLRISIRDTFDRVRDDNELASVDRLGVLSELATAADAWHAERERRDATEPDRFDRQAAETVERIETAVSTPRPTPLAQLSAHRRHAPQPPDRGAGRVRVTDSSGRRLDTQAIGGRLLDAYNDLAHSGGQRTAVRVGLEAPTERRLGDDQFTNWQSIQAALSGLDSIDALTAAGGLCAPLDSFYAQLGLSTQTRPVRDTLIGFQATRGGLTFNPPASLADVIVEDEGGAISVRTEAQLDSGTAKTVQVVTCEEAVSVTVQAIARRLQFGNLGGRAWPEQVEAWTALTLAAHARTAEQAILSAFSAASTATSTASALGTARDLVGAVSRAAAAYRSRHRMLPDAVLHAVLPAWLPDAFATDTANGVQSDPTFLAVTRAQVDGWLRARNVAATWSPDAQPFDAQPGNDTLTDFPDVVTWWLFAPGSFVHLDGGTLDLGVVRDSTLNALNRFELFSETFEATAFVGVESLQVTSHVCANGLSAGTVDTSGECAGSGFGS